MFNYKGARREVEQARQAVEAIKSRREAELTEQKARTEQMKLDLDKYIEDAITERTIQLQNETYMQEQLKIETFLKDAISKRTSQLQEEIEMQEQVERQIEEEKQKMDKFIEMFENLTIQAENVPMDLVT